MAAFHEPGADQPTLDPSQEGNWSAGVARLLGGAGGGFMVPMHWKKRKGTFHETQGAAGILPAEESEKSSADET